MTDPGDVRSP